MSTCIEGGVPIEKWVYLAEIDGFVFQFANLDQVRECRAFFAQKIHPSTMEKDHNPHEHFWHPWLARLPKGMTKEKNRVKVLKAMDEILAKWKK